MRKLANKQTKLLRGREKQVSSFLFDWRRTDGLRIAPVERSRECRVAALDGKPIDERRERRSRRLNHRKIRILASNRRCNRKRRHNKRGERSANGRAHERAARNDGKCCKYEIF